MKASTWLTTRFAEEQEYLDMIGTQGAMLQ